MARRYDSRTTIFSPAGKFILNYKNNLLKFSITY